MSTVGILDSSTASKTDLVSGSPVTVVAVTPSSLSLETKSENAETDLTETLKTIEAAVVINLTNIRNSIESKLLLAGSFSPGYTELLVMSSHLENNWGQYLQTVTNCTTILESEFRKVISASKKIGENFDVTSLTNFLTIRFIDFHDVPDNGYYFDSSYFLDFAVSVAELAEALEAHAECLASLKKDDLNTATEYFNKALKNYNKCDPGKKGNYPLSSSRSDIDIRKYSFQPTTFYVDFAIRAFEGLVRTFSEKVPNPESDEHIKNAHSVLAKMKRHYHNNAAKSSQQLEKTQQELAKRKTFAAEKEQELLRLLGEARKLRDNLDGEQSILDQQRKAQVTILETTAHSNIDDEDSSDEEEQKNQQSSTCDRDYPSDDDRATREETSSHAGYFSDQEIHDDTSSRKPDIISGGEVSGATSEWARYFANGEATITTSQTSRRSSTASSNTAENDPATPKTADNVLCLPDSHSRSMSPTP